MSKLNYDAFIEAYINQGQQAAQQQPQAAIPEPEPSLARDLGKRFKAGLQQVPGILAGLADIPVAAITGRPYVSEAAAALGEATGFQPGKWAEQTLAEVSPQHREAMLKAEQAKGVLDTAGVYLSNPELIAGQIAQSLPSILGGGVLAQGLRKLAPAVSPIAAGGIGEGAVMAGSAMESMVEQGADPRTAAGLSAAIGTLGGAIGVGGGQLAAKLGARDIETLLAGGGGRAVGTWRPSSIAARMARGFLQEGTEEAGQSAIETALSNVGLDRPLFEDVAKAATVGALVGGPMGAAINVPPSRIAAPPPASDVTPSIEPPVEPLVEPPVEPLVEPPVTPLAASPANEALRSAIKDFVSSYNFIPRNIRDELAAKLDNVNSKDDLVTALEPYKDKIRQNVVTTILNKYDTLAQSITAPETIVPAKPPKAVKQAIPTASAAPVAAEQAASAAPTKPVATKQAAPAAPAKPSKVVKQAIPTASAAPVAAEQAASAAPTKPVATKQAASAAPTKPVAAKQAAPAALAKPSKAVKQAIPTVPVAPIITKQAAPVAPAKPPKAVKQTASAAPVAAEQTAPAKSVATKQAAPTAPAKSVATKQAAPTAPAKSVATKQAAPTAPAKPVAAKQAAPAAPAAPAKPVAAKQAAPAALTKPVATKQSEEELAAFIEAANISDDQKNEIIYRLKEVKSKDDFIQLLDDAKVKGLVRKSIVDKYKALYKEAEAAPAKKFIDNKIIEELGITEKDIAEAFNKSDSIFESPDIVSTKKKENIRTDLDANTLAALVLAINGYTTRNVYDDKSDFARVEYVERILSASAPDALRLLQKIQHLTKNIEDANLKISRTTADFYYDEKTDTIRRRELRKDQTKADLQLRPFTEVDRLTVAKTVAKLKQMYNDLAKQFEQLELVLGGTPEHGHRQLAAVMYLSKLKAHNISKPISARYSTKRKPLREGELPSAVQFSKYYKMYIKAERSAKNMFTNVIETSPLREEEVVEERLQKAFKTIEDTKLGKIVSGKLSGPLVAVENEAVNILRYLRNTGNWYTKMLASRIEYVLEGNYPEINIVLNWPGGNSPLAFYNADKHEITFYADKFNNARALHEFIHAATVGFIRKNYNSPEVARLNKLLKYVVDKLEESKDTLTPHQLKILNILQDNKNKQRKGLYEFIALGFTDPVMQAFMRNTPYKVAYAKTKQNIWRRFVELIKDMLGIHGSNTAFEEFMNASTDILQGAKGATERGKGVFERGKNIFTDTFDPASSPITPEVEKAQKATDKRNTSIDVIKEAQKKGEEEAAIYAKRAAAQAKEVGDYIEEIDKKEAATAVGVKAYRRDVTGVDKIERALFNNLAALFSAGKHDSWENWTSEKLENFGKKIDKFTKQEGVVPKFTSWFLSNVVDKYGTPSAFRDMWTRFLASVHSDTETHIDYYNSMRSLSPEHQEAFITYLQNRDVKKLNDLVKDKEAANAIYNLVNAWERLFARVKAAHLVDPRYVNKPLSYFLDVKGLTGFDAYRKLALGDIKPTNYKKNVVQGETVFLTNIFDKNGDSVTLDKVKESTFYLVQSVDGGYAYIEKGIDTATMNKLKLVRVVGTKGEREYTYAGGDAEIRMESRKTFKEHLKEVQTANAITSALYTMQDWSRRLASKQFISEVISYNETLPDDSKWVLTTADTLPKDRVLDKTANPNLSEKQIMRLSRIPGYWVRIAENESKVWGNLAGSYVAGPIYAAVLDYTSNEPFINSKLYNQSHVMWKKFKTVYSPTTSINNIISNFILSYYHDITLDDIKQGARVFLGGAYPELFKQLKQLPLTKEEQELYTEFRLSGATLGQYNKAELDEQSAGYIKQLLAKEPTRSGVRGSIDAAVAMQGFMSVLGKLANFDETLSNFYSNQDNVFRLAAYISHMNRLRHTQPNMPMRRMKEMAARYAKEAFVNYDIQAPWIKALRQTVLPFLAWPYRMIPLMARTAVTKPWKIINTVLGVYILNAMAYAVTGGDEDEERKILDDYMKNNIWGIPTAPAYIRLPFGTEGKAAFFGLGRMIPLGDLGVISEAGLPGIISPSGPAVIALQAAFNHDAFTGLPIRQPTDTPEQAMGNTLAFLAKQLGPNIGYTTAKWIDTVAMDKRGPLGADANNWVETAKLLGVNIRYVDLTEQEYKTQKKLQMLQREYRTAMNKIYRNELRYGEPNLEGAYAEILKMTERMQQEIQDAMEI